MGHPNPISTQVPSPMDEMEMDSRLSSGRRFNRALLYTLSVFAILVILLPVIQIGFAVSSSPFLGEWRAADVDGNELYLTFNRLASGPLQITWTGGHASACDSKAGLVHGTDQLDPSNPYLLETDLHLECFTSDGSTDFQYTWRYHPITGTLSGRSDGGIETTWRRPEGSSEELPRLHLHVDYGADWVESLYEAGHKSWIMVTKSDGVSVKWTAELMTQPGEYGDEAEHSQIHNPAWSDGKGGRMENPPDIQPQDWVFGWVDNGASAQVQIGHIRGSVNASAGVIEGTILAPWIKAPIPVACLDWGQDEPYWGDNEAGSIMADGTQHYSCTFSGKGNLQSGMSLGVSYMDPDGDRVTNTFFTGSPSFKAFVPDSVEGYDWPMGGTITVSINGEYSARAISQQRPVASRGRTRVLFDLSKDNFSIQPGDHILMTDGSTTKDSVVSALAVTDFDVTTRKVSGTYDPALDLQVWLYDEEPEVITADPKVGNWVAIFDRLRAGSPGGASQQDADGDGTSIEFEVPQTFVVGSTEDVIANDGFCSLREAIIAANTNTASGNLKGECPHGLDSQVDIILLRAGEVYSLTIDRTGDDSAADGDLDILDNPSALDLMIRVVGDGKATISQDAVLLDDRVLENHEASVQIENLILTGGRNVGGGGGVLNHGTLEITGSIISGNSVSWDGGGINNNRGASLTIKSSSILDNRSAAFAGGIMNKGTLTLTQSEVRGNTSVHGGGGINNEGTLNIEASVLAANKSEQGGALYNSGTAVLENETLVGGPLPEDANSADGGGGLFSLGILRVSDSTVTGNHASYGGGLFNWIGGTLTINNSRVSNNHANEGGGLHNKEKSTALIQSGTVFFGNYAEWSGGGIDNWGTITITDSVLQENISHGEAGDAISSGVKGSTVIISNSCIVGNGDTAVFSTQLSEVDASKNWWGSRSGPAHRTNRDGGGDSVSDFVEFSGWLTEPPSICAP